MQKKQNMATRSIMSMEEYVKKIKRIREEEQIKGSKTEEKSPVWMLAELYN